MREPKQVLVIPYFIKEKELFLVILKRNDMNMWQWVAGGVEENEPLNFAALREASEELGIALCLTNLLSLDTFSSIPKYNFKDHIFWPDNFYIVTEYSFAIKLKDTTAIVLSDEHCEYQIIRYGDLNHYTTWDSNLTAAWELWQRLKDKGEIIK